MHGTALRIVYSLQKKLWRLVRPRTRGVKVMLFDGTGQLLLIRNSYGNRDLFVLPGGGMRLWEKPANAAAREIAEELNCKALDLRSVATFTSNAEGKRDTIHLFEGCCDAQPRIDPNEVAEARFFRLDALPPTVSPATRRRIDERRGSRAFDGKW